MTVYWEDNVQGDGYLPPGMSAAEARKIPGTGPFTAWVVLGAAASHYQGKLLWDNARMQFSNNHDATKWITPTFRKGWEIKL